MMNSIHIMGRLTRDPELRTTASGAPMVSVGIACDRVNRGNGDKITDFFNVVAWRGTAEFIAQYFHRGKMIAIDGNLRHRSFPDKNGDTKHVYEIEAEKVYFCDSKKSEDEKGFGNGKRYEDRVV